MNERRRYLRGLRLLKHSQLNGKLHGWWPWMRGMQLGQVVVPQWLETRHFLITGQTGSGKTTLIRQMLQRIEKRGQTAIVIDPHCQFLKEFYKPDRNDLVLNSLDNRCPYWNPIFETRAETFDMDIDALVSSLVRGHAMDSWHQSARTLLSAAFEVAMDADNPYAIPDFLTLPHHKLHDRLPPRAESLFSPNATNQISAIVNIAANAVRPFYHLPLAEVTERTWSAREWSEKRQGWLFFTSTTQARAQIQQLQGVWLDALVRWLMDDEKQHEQIYIVGDELPSMGYQPRIEPLLTQGRKYQIAVVIAIQNIAQLRAIYGHDAAITMASAPATKCILAVDEPETDKWLSTLIGECEEEIGNRIERRQIVMPADIQKLAPLNGYLAIAGYDRAKIQIPWMEPVEKLPAFIPRPPTKVAVKEVPFSRTELGGIWYGIRARTLPHGNPEHEKWKYYGGKGIELRLTPEEFVAVMSKFGARPSSKHSVDRIDNDGHYEAENIRGWETPKGQNARRGKRLAAATPSAPPTPVPAT